MKEKKLKSGKLVRALHLGGSVAKVGLNLAKGKLAGKQGISAAQIKAAKEMISTMGELKGGLMKVGQMISVTGDTVLPTEITELFSGLQTSSSFMPREQLENCFIEEFGKKPEAIFSSFVSEPFAAASIGQVHQASLGDGTKLAVKVQYPKIAEAIEGDLSSLGKLEKIFDIFGVPKPQMDSALEELKRSLIEECDYLKEKESMESMRSDLKNEFPNIYIPKVYHEFSSSKIICTEFVEGDSFNETRNYTQVDRDLLGTSLYESFLYSLFVTRHLHTDPQNGNYLFKANQIYLFDFGSTRKFSSDFVEDYAVLQHAVEISDLSLYKKVGLNLGLLLEDDSQSFVKEHADLVAKIYGPFLREGSYFAKAPNPFGLVKEFFKNMNFKGRATPTDEFLLLDRANVGLFMKLQSWESRVNWREGMKKYREPALERGLARYNQSDYK